MKYDILSHQSCANTGVGMDIGTGHELMIDAKISSALLRLPLYWFSDPNMRAKYRIPHYLMGGLVRYRVSELQAWVASSQSIATPERRDDLNAKTNGGESEAGMPDA